MFESPSSSSSPKFQFAAASMYIQQPMVLPKAFVYRDFTVMVCGFQLLICHYGRYAVPIVTLLPPLGSSTGQTTLIVGGLTKGSERVLSL